MEAKLTSTAIQLKQSPSDFQKEDVIAGQELKRWVESQRIKEVTEDVILSYLREKALAMNLHRIKCMFFKYRARYPLILLKPYSELRASILRRRAEADPPSSQILTSEQCQRFLTEAQERLHLLHKVIAILAIKGSLNRSAIRNIKASDVTDFTDFIVVHTLQKQFKIENEASIKYADIVRRYMDLRLKEYEEPGFLLAYNCNGWCRNEPVSVHRIETTPVAMAKFLNLPNPGTYTIPSFVPHRFSIKWAYLKSN